MTNAVTALEAAFQKTQAEIPFDRNWSNSTGGFDYAVYSEHRVELPSGKTAKSTTPGGRKIVFVGTHLGTVAVFDRTIKINGTDTKVVDMNATSAFMKCRWLSVGDSLLADEVELLLGSEQDGWQNIGIIIDSIAEAAQKIKLA